MNQQARIEAEAPARVGRWRRDAAALGVAAVAYLAVFAATRTDDPGALLLATLRNVGSLAIVAAAAREIVQRKIVGRRRPAQVACHAASAAAFTLGWYWLLTVAVGMFDGQSPLRFIVTPFLLGPALEWQLFQGLAVYGMVAALSHLEAATDRERLARGADVADVPAFAPGTGDPQRADLQTYFIRTGEDIVPVAVADIVSIAGADDYAHVTTMAGSHLARMTLAEFEASLDPARFLRVHRSRIVHTARIVRAEPAGGGRLLLHMAAGETVTSSRAGARLLRDRVL